jgi:FkbM family methyltransferase
MKDLFEMRASYQAGTIDKNQYIDDMHLLHERLFEYSEYLRDTDIGRIEITDGRVVMTSKATNVRILCDQASRRIAPLEILNFGSYEKAELALILQLMEDRFTIFDVGANVGWYSLNFAKLFEHVQVHAFEPIPPTYAYLKANIKLNGATNVHPHNLGLSDHSGEVTFYYHPECSYSASAVDLSRKPDVQTVKCRVTTLDQFAEENAVSVDFLKCDVEGAELLVLSGAMATIKRDKPVIFAEMLRKWSAKFGYHPNDIIALLSGAGYKCFTLNGRGLDPFTRMDDKTAATNFFFLHSDKHAAKMDALAAATAT